MKIQLTFQETKEKILKLLSLPQTTEFEITDFSSIYPIGFAIADQKSVVNEVVNEKPLISNIWMSNNFKSKIGDYQSGGKAHEGLFHTLEKAMHDTEIMKKWDIVPLSVQDFWATLAPILEKQKNGEEGVLKTCWISNLFYVQTSKNIMVVRAWWHSVDSEWCLGVDGLDEDGGWGAGFVFFAPATV